MARAIHSRRWQAAGAAAMFAPVAGIAGNRRASRPAPALAVITAPAAYGTVITSGPEQIASAHESSGTGAAPACINAGHIYLRDHTIPIRAGGQKKDNHYRDLRPERNPGE